MQAMAFNAGFRFVKVNSVLQFGKIEIIQVYFSAIENSLFFSPTRCLSSIEAIQRFLYLFEALCNRDISVVRACKNLSDCKKLRCVLHHEIMLLALTFLI